MAEPEGALSAVSFSSFIISLAQAALVHIGETPDPTSGKKSQELALARHTIDSLSMLEDKTSGNLDEDQAKLLSSLLHELRGKFVAASKASRGEA